MTPETTVWPLSREQIDALPYAEMGDVLKARGVADVPRDGDGRRAALKALASLATSPATQQSYEPPDSSPLETVATTPVDLRRRAEPAGFLREAVDVGPDAPEISADASLAPPAADDEDLQTRIERIRNLRRPFGAATQKLALPQRPNYKRHWFNDTGARVQEALDSGWSHVLGRDRKPIKRAVGTGRDNGVLYAYAMELPEVFWQEDMAARHEQAKGKMDAIKASPFRAAPGTAQKSDQGKFYSPVEGVDPIQIVKH